MIGRTLSTDVPDVLGRVADFFSPHARDTILCENLHKHTFEIGSIRQHAGAEGTVCDLGGGLGVNLLALRLLGHRGRLVLIDRFDEYDEDNRMGSWRSASEILRNHDIECIRQDFWAEPSLPLPEGCASVTTCFDVVEHLPGHPLRQLRELKRLLRPGGICMISGPNSISLMKRIKLAAGRHPYTPLSAWMDEPYYEHYREYSPGEYGELLRKAGFAEVESIASAVVTTCRARAGYHRRRLPITSPKRLALWGLATVETVVPSLRHMAYAWGTRAA